MWMDLPIQKILNLFCVVYLRNKFDVLSVHEIMNISGLVQSK